MTRKPFCACGRCMGLVIYSVGTAGYGSNPAKLLSLPRVTSNGACGGGANSLFLWGQSSWITPGPLGWTKGKTTWVSMANVAVLWEGTRAEGAAQYCEGRGEKWNWEVKTHSVHSPPFGDAASCPSLLPLQADVLCFGTGKRNWLGSVWHWCRSESLQENRATLEMCSPLLDCCLPPPAMDRWWAGLFCTHLNLSTCSSLQPSFPLLWWHTPDFLTLDFSNAFTNIPLTPCHLTTGSLRALS